MIKCETMLSLLFFSPMGKSIAIYFFYLVLLKLESQHEFNEKTIFFHCFISVPWDHCWWLKYQVQKLMIWFYTVPLNDFLFMKNKEIWHYLCKSCSEVDSGDSSFTIHFVSSIALLFPSFQVVQSWK